MFLFRLIINIISSYDCENLHLIDFYLIIKKHFINLLKTLIYQHLLNHFTQIHFFSILIYKLFFFMFRYFKERLICTYILFKTNQITLSSKPPLSKSIYFCFLFKHYHHIKILFIINISAITIKHKEYHKMHNSYL